MHNTLYVDYVIRNLITNEYYCGWYWNNRDKHTYDAWSDDISQSKAYDSKEYALRVIDNMDNPKEGLPFAMTIVEIIRKS